MTDLYNAQVYIPGGPSTVLLSNKAGDLWLAAKALIREGAHDSASIWAPDNSLIGSINRDDLKRMPLKAERAQLGLLWGVHEIAEAAQVKHQTVSSWEERREDFPKPLARLAMGPVYDQKEVIEWLGRTGHLKTAGTET